MMKKIYFLFLVTLSAVSNAQLKKIKTFSFNEPYWAGRTVNPIADGWQNKFFYQGIGNNANPQPLMVTDGTTDGTKIVKTFPTATYSALKEIKSTDNWLYFTVINTTSKQNELWRTDGTAGNTIKIDETTGVSPNLVLQRQSEYFQLGHGMNNAKTDLNGFVYYFKDNKLYRTNGEVGAQQQLLENARNYGYYFVADGAFYFSNFRDGKIYKHDGTTLSVFFSSYNDNNGTIHYPQDLLGATEGKIWVKGILNREHCIFSIDASGNATKEYSVNHLSLVDYNYVSGNYNQNGFYIMLHNWHNGSSTYDILYFTDQGLKSLLLPYSLDINSAHITKDNLYLIHQIDNDSNYTMYIKKYTSDLEFLSETTTDYRSFGASAAKIGSYQNAVWFQHAYKGANPMDVELWRTDGTSENTRQVFNIDPNYSSSPTNYFTLNGKLYFFAANTAIYNLYEYSGDYTFTNFSGDNLWNNDANWKSGLTPSSVDEAVIPASFQPIVDGDASVKNIDLNSTLAINQGNLGVYGNLKLNSGISLSGGNLILKGNKSHIEIGNENNYIVTNGNSTVKIESLNSSRGVMNLPIGTSNSYNPISISNSGVSDHFTVKVSQGVANTTSGNVGRTWEISEQSEGGSDVALTLGWNASHHANGFSLANAKIGHFLNGIWTEENSGLVSGSDLYQLTATGISNFSPFTVMNFGTLSTEGNFINQNKVYPNPFVEELTLDVETNGTFYLYETSGKLILSNSIIKGKNKIQTTSIEKGLYYYTFVALDNKLIKAGKLIKK